MTPDDILTRLTADGVRLEVDGDKILASPAASLTDTHRKLIRRHKAALVALLSESRRLWDIVEPSGCCWRLSFCPHVAQAQVRAWYPGAQITPAEQQETTT